MPDTKKTALGERGNEYIEKLRTLTKDPRFLKAAVFIGIGAMALILITSVSGNNKKAEKPAEVPAEVAEIFSYTESFAAKTEERLKTLLAGIEGVGDTEVMVTLGASEEYVYAQDGKESSSGTSSEVVIIDGKDGKSALVERVFTPKITGVVIVCEGGDDSRTVEKIYKAVSTALGIGASRIYVTEQK
jgi:stage III sporulation protein AG